MVNSEAPQDLPPIELLRDIFTYSPDSGVLTWRRRDRGQFATGGAWKAWNTRNAGKPVGAKNSSGYLQAQFTLFGRVYRPLVHVIAWALQTGEWPEHQVDHENHTRDDNRWANLREATPGENMRNRKRPSSNKSGTTGVFMDNRSGRWIAQITWEAATYHLGSFVTKAEAEHRRFIVAAAYGFHPNHGVNTEDGETPGWVDWVEVWSDDSTEGSTHDLP